MGLWGRNLADARTITSIDHPGPMNALAVLQELVELLEDYAPTWYTEEHHNRAAAALGELLPQGTIQ
jgi:hypothetical protein